MACDEFMELVGKSIWNAAQYVIDEFEKPENRLIFWWNNVRRISIHERKTEMRLLSFELRNKVKK
jgi:hypothetical protein